MLKKIKVIVSVLLISNLFSPTGPILAQFNPNFIISDNELTDYNSMNLSQIQDFLEDHDSYLATYIDPNVRWTAAYTIDFFSRFYKVNPKYMLVLLQKEQSLVKEESPTQDQLDWATGYGICDGCKKTDDKVQKYKGFVNQVDWGAGGTRFYFDNPDKFRYQVGESYNIDGEQVTITNHATRSLYIYTPHIHGNKNLYNVWQEWFSSTFLEGSLLQSTEDGAIWLIRDGKKHPFLSKSAYLSRYNSFDRVILAKPADLAKYPTGSPIEYPNYSLLQIPTGGIYLLDDDTLRPIISKETFRLLGFNPEEVIQVESKDIFAYKIGQPITAKDAYPTGALLQDNVTGGVYYVQSGVKRPIVSKDLMNLYYKNYKMTAVTPAELEKYKTGETVKLKEGELATSPSSNAVYVISEEEKRAFASAEDFEKLGYKWENIVKVENKVLEMHDEGELVTAGK